MNVERILEGLRASADPKAVSGMARYGINPRGTLGVSIPKLRDAAKKIGPNHDTALGLWDSGVHEARILASLVERPHCVTKEQAERWVRTFDSWDVCDQCCNNLFRKLPWARELAVEWALRPEEFVKRAGFVLIACLAVHDKTASDETFKAFLPVITREASDSRNFVKKAVCWALRQIGKRNAALNGEAIEVARELHMAGTTSARWIAVSALEELTGPAVRRRLTDD